VTSRLHPNHTPGLRNRRLWAGESASQIVEFAVALPLLVVFVVGIFDFSGAFTLKQKLANAAREGARAAAAGPANDLSAPATSSGVPASVTDAFAVVDHYLTSEQINDCGISLTSFTNTGLSWLFTATGNGCPGNGLQIRINRGCSTVQAVGATAVNVVGTCVNIKYSYQWRFNSVITLIVPATYKGVTDLSGSAAALNEN
jgi:hypothetical protein